MHTLDVIRPGMLTTVQDGGRWGWQAQGVSVAGPMDPFSFRMANAMAGNDRRAAALEVTLAGPTVTLSDTRLVAVSGAEFRLFVDERPVVATHAFVLPHGAVLRFGERVRGARAYLAIAGGIATPRLLGSSATHLASKLGGFEGRALAKGDKVPLGPAHGARPVHAHPLNAVVRTPATAPIRVMAGPDAHGFTSEAIAAFVDGSYVVDAASDRTGYRLLGREIPRSSADDQLSDVTPMGTIQVPASRQPIVLMADRQTTGGYPRLATVITADLGVLGQAAPGDRCRFVTCSREEAHEALFDVERPLMAIEVPR